MEKNKGKFPYFPFSYSFIELREKDEYMFPTYTIRIPRTPKISCVECEEDIKCRG